MFKILKILRKDQINHLILILFLMFCVAVLETFTIGAVLPILSTFTNQSTEINFLNDFLRKFKNVDQSQNLIMLCSLILLISYLLKNVFIYLYTKVVSSFMGHLSLDQQRKTFEKYLNISYLQIKDKSSGEILRDVSQESKLIVGQYISPMLTLIQNVLIIIFISFFLFIYNTKITLSLIFLLLLLLYFFNFLFKKKLESYGLQRQSLNKSILESIKETFDGLRDLKIYKKENFFLEKFIRHSIKFTNIGVRRSVISILPKLYAETLIMIIFISFFVLSIHYGNPASTVIAYISVYAVAGFRLLPVFLSAIGAYQKINYTQSAVDLIAKILSEENIHSSKKSKDTIKFDKEIILNNVSFNYTENQIILKNFSLKIEKNSFVGIYGESGSGKSTFVDLLIGLIEPTKGEILLDGSDIKLFGKNYLDLFSYVQQKVHLFDDTLLKNITFTSDINDVDKDRLDYALKFCSLESMIENSEEGLNLQLGEFGTSISGGQLQRVGLARAIYKNSDIIILDEPLSNLDEANKDKILNRIIELKTNKTIIYISHDINELKKCDKIIEIQKV